MLRARRPAALRDGSLQPPPVNAIQTHCETTLIRLPIVSDLLGSPRFHAICLVITSTAAIEALFAIWAATSRRHWFWRALAVWAGVVGLLPIRAYQPALVFAISSPLTIAVLRAIQRRSATPSFPRSAWERTPRRSASHALNEPEMKNDEPVTNANAPFSRLRFSVRDLLLATALVGLLLASLMQLMPRLGQIHAAELALTIAAQTLIPTLAWSAIMTT